MKAGKTWATLKAWDIEEKRNMDQLSVPREPCHFPADDGRDQKLRYKCESNCSIFVNDNGKDWDWKTSPGELNYSVNAYQAQIEWTEMYLILSEMHAYFLPLQL